MIELPEALVIARQMDKELAGKRIVRGDRGNSPHKFAFSSGTSEEYEGILKGKTGYMSPEQVRGEKILHEMERLERRKRSPKVLGCLPWVLLAVLVLAIIVIASVHRERLSGYWQRLVNPESVLTE